MQENVVEMRLALNDLFLRMFEYGDPVKFMKDEFDVVFSGLEERELRNHYETFVKEFKKRMH